MTIGILAWVIWIGCVTVSSEGTAEGVQTFYFDPELPEVVASNGTQPVLLVVDPQAPAAFATRRMAYIQRAFELQYYARNQWSDAPPRMLEPLLVDALERSGYFSAVVGPANGGLADVRLHTEIVLLQQEFDTVPSRVRMTVRVQLIDLDTRAVLGTEVLEEVETAPSDDAYGGVTATNLALSRILERVVDFCGRITTTVN